MRFKFMFLLAGIFVTLRLFDCEAADNNLQVSIIKDLKAVVRGCKAAQDYTEIWNCLKRFLIEKVDDITSSDEIPLMRGVKLVRPPNAATSLHATKLVDAKYIQDNPKSKQGLSSWPYFTLEEISQAISTRVLQINISELCSEETCNTVTGRHRRHRNNMMVAMVFGVTALGSIMVPLGFQFLAVLGGKALLLAKMALLLASINGLKRIATSGVHYGLYQVPEHLNYGYYDRGDAHHPRSSKQK